jgi:predicted transcriptional regulator
MADIGRPPWVPGKEIIEQAECLAERGLTQQQIADSLGIGLSTLYDKKNEFEDFAEAIKRGQAKGIAHVSNNLMKNIENGNVTAQIFFLKCRAGWKETEIREVTGKDSEPVKHEVKLAVEEIDNRIASILER